jgi:hypothetical protein
MVGARVRLNIRRALPKNPVKMNTFLFPTLSEMLPHIRENITYAARFIETNKLVSATDMTSNLTITNSSITGYINVILNISRNVKIPRIYISR